MQLNWTKKSLSTNDVIDLLTTKVNFKANVDKQSYRILYSLGNKYCINQLEMYYSKNIVFVNGELRVAYHYNYKDIVFDEIIVRSENH